MPERRSLSLAVWLALAKATPLQAEALGIGEHAQAVLGAASNEPQQLDAA